MWNKKIGTNQINARLGDLSSPRQQQSYAPSEYDEYDDQPVQHQAISRNNDYGQVDNSSSGVVFFASIVAVFLAVSFGTYLFVSGTNPFSGLNLKVTPTAAFVSKVDPICKPLWSSPGFNQDALACYMVESPERFCDANERQNLVALFDQYRTDLAAEQRIELNSFIAGQPEMFKQLDQAIKDSDAGRPVKAIKSKFKIPTHKYLHELTIEQFMKKSQEQTMGLLSGKLHPGDSEELTAMLRKILEKGYFQPDEFGWNKDYMVQAALAAPLPDIKPQCLNQKAQN